ncbi:MAG: M48 family metallopeptidase [Synergistaceae bacterium]|nr:M48 family metallopeptidase [Candidatus Equadaptatus faecalis]
MGETIIISGQSYAVRRSARRKNITVKADLSGNITVAFPAGYNVSAATEKLLAPLLEEIIKRTAALPQAKNYTDGELYLFAGREYPLRLTDGNEGLKFDGSRFLLDKGRQAEARKLFERWYARALEKRLASILPRLCKTLDVSPARISVKTVSTVWGSCSAKRNITFCTRLALLPDRLFEYVAVHELCHLKELNHSAAFWREVEKLVPDYKERRAELNRDSRLYKWW